MGDEKSLTLGVQKYLIDNYAKITSPDGFDYMMSDTVYNRIAEFLQFCDTHCPYFRMPLKGVQGSCQGECSMIADTMVYHDFAYLLLTDNVSAIEDIRKRAYIFARQRHAGHFDDDGKDYFFAHLLPVYKIIGQLAPLDVHLQCAALLHDVLEDTKTTYEELVELFNEDIADLVREVTNERNAADTEWYFPYLKTRRGILLKFVDRSSNISRMNAWNEKRQQKYLEKSKFWKNGE